MCCRVNTDVLGRRASSLREWLKVNDSGRVQWRGKKWDSVSHGCVFGKGSGLRTHEDRLRRRWEELLLRLNTVCMRNVEIVDGNLHLFSLGGSCIQTVAGIYWEWIGTETMCVSFREMKSIHPFSVLHSRSQGLLGPIPAAVGQRQGTNLDKFSNIANNRCTHTYFAIRLICMFLEDGRKPE